MIVNVCTSFICIIDNHQPYYDHDDYNAEDAYDDSEDDYIPARSPIIEEEPVERRLSSNVVENVENEDEVEDEDHDSNDDTEEANDYSEDSEEDDEEGEGLTPLEKQEAAKQFLQQFWTTHCSCLTSPRSKKNEGRYLTLRRWVNGIRRDCPNPFRSTTIDDSIYQLDEQGPIPWKDILGAELHVEDLDNEDELHQQQPYLSLHDSQPTNSEGVLRSFPFSPQRTWDIDAIILRVKSLNVFQTRLNIDYLPSYTLNFHRDAHVRIRGRRPDRMKHLCIGTTPSAQHFRLYIFFPELPVTAGAKESYLNLDEQQVWVDDILLPALRVVCPANVVQHHPHSFEEARTKALGYQREGSSGKDRYIHRMSYVVDAKFLGPLWEKIRSLTYLREAAPDLAPGGRPLRAQFTDPILMLWSYGTKLSFRDASPVACRDKLEQDLRMVFNEEEIDWRKAWVDLAYEDTPDWNFYQQGFTLIPKASCQHHISQQLQYQENQPRLTTTNYSWNLCHDACSTQQALAQSNPLFQGGILFHQRYEVIKNLFSLPQKDHRLFGDNDLAGLAFTPEVLAHSRRHIRLNPRNKGNKTDRLFKALCAAKNRVRTGLKSISKEDSFAMRDEFRITWALLAALDANAPSQPESLPDPTSVDCHAPYFILPTEDVIKFDYWQMARWIAAIEFHNTKTRNQPTQPAEAPALQVENGAVTFACQQILKACHGPSAMLVSNFLTANEYVVKNAQAQGLDLLRVLRETGVVGIPTHLLNWADLRFKPQFFEKVRFPHYSLSTIYHLPQVARANVPNGSLQERFIARCQLVAPQCYLPPQAGREERRHARKAIANLQKLGYQIVAYHFIDYIHELCTGEADFEFGQEKLVPLNYHCLKAWLGCEPNIYIPRQRAGGPFDGFKFDWFTRLGLVFDWDDGFKRTWDAKLPFRACVRWVYDFMLSHASLDIAHAWRRNLGFGLAPYIWFVPRYEVDRFAQRQRKDGGQLDENMALQWMSASHPSDQMVADGYNRTKPNWRLPPEIDEFWENPAEWEFVSKMPLIMNSRLTGVKERVLYKMTLLEQLLLEED